MLTRTAHPAMIARPADTEYAEYYGRYIARVPEGNLLHFLRRQGEEAAALARGLTAEQAAHRYAPGKWSIKQVLGHVIDAERIFAYRALRIGRGDQTPLPGFDENPYVEAANFDARTAADLATELEHVRHATLDLLRHLDDQALARMGTASNFPVSVRALAWIIAGHMQHHLSLVRERYLTAAAPVPPA